MRSITNPPTSDDAGLRKLNAICTATIVTRRNIFRDDTNTLLDEFVSDLKQKE
jgi:hypothetical protein